VKFIWANAKAFPYKLLVFENPLEVLKLETLSQLTSFFDKLQNFIKRGFYACGFLTFELGYLLENRLKKFLRKSDLPLAWFAIYSNPTSFFLNPLELKKDKFDVDGITLNNFKYF
jgi:para-aminobenzoate synthetase/4-amino-4-deoxychorismate lyase